MGDNDKPTQIAEAYFQAVAQVGARGSGSNKFEDRDHAYCFSKLAEGLQQLAVGLRATYLLLDEVKELIKRQKP